MSVIQEALKKAEHDVNIPDVAAEPKRPPITGHVKPAAKPVAQKRVRLPLNAEKALTAVLLLALIVAAFFFVGQFLPKPGSRPKLTQEVSYRPIIKDESDVSGPNAAGKRPIAPIGIPRVLRNPDLILNGIMYLEDGPRAIINNNIIETGDSVSGAIVTKINRQNVVLEYEDVEITLNLK